MTGYACGRERDDDVLRSVLAHPSMSARARGEALHRSESSVQRALADLEAAGRIARRVSPPRGPGRPPCAWAAL